MLKLIRNIAIVMITLYFSKPIQPKVMQEYTDTIISKATEIFNQYVSSDAVDNIYNIIKPLIQGNPLKDSGKE